MTKETENISKIRDILFGNNLTELEKRVAKTEVFLRDEITSLDEKLGNRFDELKSLQKNPSQRLIRGYRQRKRNVKRKLSRYVRNSHRSGSLSGSSMRNFPANWVQ